MPWFRLENDFYIDVSRHGVSPLAELLFVRAIAYVHRNKSDGSMADKALYHLAFDFAPHYNIDPNKVIAELEEADLIVREGDQLHIKNYLKYQESRAKIEEKRVKNNVRQALFRDGDLKARVRLRDQEKCRYCGRAVSFTNRIGRAGGTYDHVDPAIANLFENLVVSCRECNSRKGARTPNEANMTLLPPPPPVTSYESLDNELVTSYGGNGSSSRLVDSKDVVDTTTTTRGNQLVTSYSERVTSYSNGADLSSECVYETQIVPNFFKTQASKIARASHEEMGEDWIRHRLREVFAVQGPLPEETVRARFTLATRQVLANATAYHEGSLRKNLRTSLGNYARGTFINAMKGEDRR